MQNAGRPQTVPAKKGRLRGHTSHRLDGIPCDAVNVSEMNHHGALYDKACVAGESIKPGRKPQAAYAPNYASTRLRGL